MQVFPAQRLREVKTKITFIPEILAHNNRRQGVNRNLEILQECQKRGASKVYSFGVNTKIKAVITFIFKEREDFS